MKKLRISLYLYLSFPNQDLLHRHKTEEDEALRMAAGYFTAEEVEKAEEAIRAMMLFSGEEEKEEEAKLPKVEGGKDEQEVRQRILANFPCQRLGKCGF